jgi:hypothetical protein
MFISKEGYIVIDDVSICSFFKDQNGEVMKRFEDLMRTLCFFFSNSTVEHKNEVIMEFPTEFYQVINGLKERIDLSQSKDVLMMMHEHVKNLNAKVEHFFMVRTKNSFKGDSGEKDLMEVLENVLPIREGYSIQDRSSIPHNCDLLITKTGKPDIRIEVKNHGESVRSAEVKRFESDVTKLKNHGIFVSLNSPIVGKSNMEIDLLPTNKLACYLSNNNYDGQTIKELINVIYMMDGFMSDDSELKMSYDTMTKIKTYLNDYANKVIHLRLNMKSSLEILNSISFDAIERLLTGEHNVEPSTRACEYCTKEYKKRSTLDKHERSCKKRPKELLSLPDVSISSDQSGSIDL